MNRRNDTSRVRNRSPGSTSSPRKLNNFDTEKPTGIRFPDGTRTGIQTYVYRPVAVIDYFTITWSSVVLIKPNSANFSVAILKKFGSWNTLSTCAIKMADSDYALRAQQFGFASDESIREAFQQSGTIILDVRTVEEISMNGRLTDTTTFPSDRLTYIQSDCTPTDCYTLRTAPQDLIPNLTTSTSTIVIHCASGRRAVRAKEILTEHGYKGTIINAGGFNDVQKFFEQ